MSNQAALSVAEYWTKEEREARSYCTGEDTGGTDHSDKDTCPIHEGIEMGIEEYRRILATVDALESALLAILDGQLTGNVDLDAERFQKARALLAVLQEER